MGTLAGRPLARAGANNAARGGGGEWRGLGEMERAEASEPAAAGPSGRRPICRELAGGGGGAGRDGGRHSPAPEAAAGGKAALAAAGELRGDGAATGPPAAVPLVDCTSHPDDVAGVAVEATGGVDGCCPDQATVPTAAFDITAEEEELAPGREG